MRVLARAPIGGPAWASSSSIRRNVTLVCQNVSHAHHAHVLSERSLYSVAYGRVLAPGLTSSNLFRASITARGGMKTFHLCVGSELQVPHLPLKFSTSSFFFERNPRLVTI
jgi:hypothetical protein